MSMAGGHGAMVDFRFTETAVKGVKDYTLKTHIRGTGAILAGCIKMENATKRNLQWKSGRGSPPGGRATGGLKKSYGHTVVSLFSRIKITGIIGTNSKTAKYVEGVGRRIPLRRHFVSFDIAPGLRQWAKRHRLPKSWWGAKSKGMMVGGPGSVTPHLRPAFDKNVNAVRRKIEKALRPH